MSHQPSTDKESKSKAPPLPLGWTQIRRTKKRTRPYSSTVAAAADDDAAGGDKFKDKDKGDGPLGRRTNDSPWCPCEDSECSYDGTADATTLFAERETSGAGRGGGTASASASASASSALPLSTAGKKEREGEGKEPNKEVEEEDEEKQKEKNQKQHPTTITIRGTAVLLLPDIDSTWFQGYLVPVAATPLTVFSSPLYDKEEGLGAGEGKRVRGKYKPLGLLAVQRTDTDDCLKCSEGGYREMDLTVYSFAGNGGVGGERHRSAALDGSGADQCVQRGPRTFDVHPRVGRGGKDGGASTIPRKLVFERAVCTGGDLVRLRAHSALSYPSLSSPESYRASFDGNRVLTGRGAEPYVHRFFASVLRRLGSAGGQNGGGAGVGVGAGAGAGDGDGDGVNANAGAGHGAATSVGRRVKDNEKKKHGVMACKKENMNDDDTNNKNNVGKEKRVEDVLPDCAIVLGDMVLTAPRSFIVNDTMPMSSPSRASASEGVKMDGGFLSD